MGLFNSHPMSSPVSTQHIRTVADLGLTRLAGKAQTQQAITSQCQQEGENLNEKQSSNFYSDDKSIKKKEIIHSDDLRYLHC